MFYILCVCGFGGMYQRGSEVVPDFIPTNHFVALVERNLGHLVEVVQVRIVLGHRVEMLGVVSCDTSESELWQGRNCSMGPQ